MKQKSVLKLSLVFNFLLLGSLLFFILQTQLFRFHPVQKLSANFEQELISLGALALSSEDIPVGAILTYKDEIIGRGFNTVLRDQNIAGHAEINAINDAINNLGYDTFWALDKSNLTIISTYEPCEMCKGTFVHYRIGKVQFLKDKSLNRWIKNDAAGMKYEMDKRQISRKNIQDSLFRLHPHYPGTE